ncbi:hypothetical protein AB1Y20_003106 [Prymnesium parvum]|uniref:D-isomer specific 2-hydroxyacid dehydrogenase NAD-binding domain-containing protein n=1 Tax=Prymnesium parvum TaxID=97485 RepID=A0AB34JDP9_PRYPA
MRARGLDVAAFDWLDSAAALESDGARAVLARAHVIVGEPSVCAPLLEHCRSLVWLQSTFAGCNQLLQQPRRDFVATRLAGQFGPDMAEYTALHVLGCERRLRSLWESQQRCEWAAGGGYRRLSALTLGVLGLGDIGSCVARTMRRAFQMEVIGCRRREGGGGEAEVARTYSTRELPAFLARCDYIVSVLPSTAATAGLLAGDALAPCAARRPVLLNVGRGDLIPEESILRALEQGWISHYVGDVFASEPLPQSSLLWKHPQVTITPHIAAVTQSSDVAEAFASNMRRFEQGGVAALHHVVDWSSGY